MSDFFRPPPERDQPDQARHRMPPWVSAPSGILPGTVALERVIARTDRVAVCVTGIGAYPQGFTVDLVAMIRPEEDLDPMLLHRQHMHGHRSGEGLPPEMLRFGIRCADGSSATNVTGGFRHDKPEPGDRVLHQGGGSGGGSEMRQTYWTWPAPPPGPLAFVCEWPAMDIPLTEYEIDAQEILDAAARAQVIFSDEHLPEALDGVG